MILSFSSEWFKLAFSASENEVSAFEIMKAISLFNCKKLCVSLWRNQRYSLRGSEITYFAYGTELSNHGTYSGRAVGFPIFSVYSPFVFILAHVSPPRCCVCVTFLSGFHKTVGFVISTVDGGS